GEDDAGKGQREGIVHARSATFRRVEPSPRTTDPLTPTLSRGERGREYLAEPRVRGAMISLVALAMLSQADAGTPLVVYRSRAEVPAQLAAAVPESFDFAKFMLASDPVGANEKVAGVMRTSMKPAP